MHQPHRALQPDLDNVRVRQRSIELYWHPRYIEPGDLAASGFFAIPECRGELYCFNCSLRVSDWAEHDNAWLPHYQGSPSCSHLLAQLASRRTVGLEYSGMHQLMQRDSNLRPHEPRLQQGVALLRVIDIHVPLTASEQLRRLGDNASPQQPQDIIKYRVTHRSNLPNFEAAKIRRPTCCVCLDRPIKILLLPCRHLCCCSDCFRQLPSSKCPLCRSDIEGHIPIRWA